MPDLDVVYIRVTDEVKPRREYSIVESTFDPDVHTKLDKPGAAPDGQPLPAKSTPESLSDKSKSGRTAESKES